MIESAICDQGPARDSILLPNMLHGNPYELDLPIISRRIPSTHLLCIILNPRHSFTLQKARNEIMSFSYDGLPPLSRSSVNHEGLTPEQEWAKIADAAERRKIQNRNAQRKYSKSSTWMPSQTISNSMEDTT